MNPFYPILIILDKLFKSIDKKTSRMIANFFSFTIFILVLAGAYYGYKLGASDAKIKSKPIIETTDEMFELNIKKEQDDGDFSTMIESEVIKKSKNSLQKGEFRSIDRMKPEVDDGIIDAEKDKKIRVTPGMDLRDRISEGDYGYHDNKEADVRKLRREEKKEYEPEMAVEEKTTGNPGAPAPDEKQGEAEKKDSRSRIIRQQKAKEPGLIYKNEGIIER